MKFTIHTAARAWAVDRRTLGRALATAGHEIKPGAKFTPKQICAALHSDAERARCRETTARARLAEMKASEMADDLMPTSIVRGVLRDCFQPVRSAILSLPNECAAKCNPSDPEYARVVLLQWVDSVLPRIRNSLPKT
jgi:phage terminase Nu1 subunit (DNA packaging protein)